MKLYAHPFSSYSQKVLIALYENATPFEYCSLEDATANAELVSLWPLKRFPVLAERGRTILESSTIIEYLQIHHPGPVCLIPQGDAGIEVRMLDRVFDNYVMTPMQKIVLDRLRPESEGDAHGVAEARGFLDQVYAWLDGHLADRAWAAGHNRDTGRDRGAGRFGKINPRTTCQSREERDMATGSVQLHRVLRAPPERVYRAFLDADAMAKWIPPNGFTCKVHHMDARIGGTYRMSFTNFTTGQSHAFGGEYLEIVPNQRLCYTDKFDDPNLPGVMMTTVSLREVFCGTDLRIVQDGIPEVIPVESCYQGWQESLILLAKLVEAEIRE